MTEFPERKETLFAVGECRGELLASWLDRVEDVLFLGIGMIDDVSDCVADRLCPIERGRDKL